MRDYAFTIVEVSPLVRNVRGSQTGETLQFDRRVSTIKTDVGVPVAYADIAMTLQVAQGLSFQVELVVPGNKVRDDIGTAFSATGDFEQVLRGSPRHCGLSGAAYESVIAASALHNHRTGAAHELSRSASTHHCCFAADRELLVNVLRRRTMGV